jgi:hypothetical protein
VIISDEALSSETGNGTEFVVLMRGEPAKRASNSDTEARWLKSVISVRVGLIGVGPHRGANHGALGSAARQK